MVAIVGVIAVAALLAAALAGGLARERHRRHRAEQQVALLETRVSELAETAAAQILARRSLDLPPLREPRQGRHLRAVQGVLWPAALAGLVEAARRHPARVGAALAATTLAGLVALPLIGPGDPQPSRPDPPPAAAAPPPAAAPPNAQFPDLPVPELEPEPGPGEPEMERVAVELPAEPGPAAPPAVPSPAAPAPPPDPPEATPAPPAPEPAPSPSPVPPPADPPADDDPGLPCADLGLLGLVKLHVCLLP